MSFINKIKKIYRLVVRKNIKKQLAYVGTNVSIPADIIVAGEKNIEIHNNVNLGKGVVLFATNARIIIKQWFISSHNLKIITGDHERRIGRFCASITEKEKNHDIDLDQDVIINEDVWCGMNVIILKGVTIGRGCTICAGAVVTKSTPPYAIIGGIPAKIIKFYWSIDEIIRHEAVVYPKEERFTRDELENIFSQYEK